MSVAKHLQELEEALLTQTVRRDSRAVGSMLAEEFLEFGSSGRAFTKVEILEALHSEAESHMTLDHFKYSQLAEGVALITYRSNRTQPGHAPVESLRSSIWVLREERWQMIFHQGTRAGLVKE